MKESRIELVSNDAVSIDGREHPITLLDTIVPNDGYYFRPYAFTDELGKEADGCVFMIYPYETTRTVYVKEDKKFEDAVIRGNGWFHAVSPEGEVITYGFTQSEKSRMVEYGKGWVITWIAGADGLDVLNLTTPPFTDSAEVAVEVGSQVSEGKTIPQKYWELLRKLKTPRAIPLKEGPLAV